MLFNVFNNLLPYLKTSPIEFLIHFGRPMAQLIAPSSNFLGPNLIEKEFKFDFLTQKYEKNMPPVFFDTLFFGLNNRIFQKFLQILKERGQKTVIPKK